MRFGWPILLNYDAASPVGSMEIEGEEGDRFDKVVIAPATVDGEVVNFGIFPMSQLNHRFGAAMLAIEQHQKVSDRLGRARENGELSDAQVLETSAEADGELYKRFDDLWLENQVEVNQKIETLETVLDGDHDGEYVLNVKDGEVIGIKPIPAQHVVELRDSGFSMEHPTECRLDGKSLHDCEVWNRLQRVSEEEPERLEDMRGRYVATVDPEKDKLILVEEPDVS